MQILKKVSIKWWLFLSIILVLWGVAELHRADVCISQMRVIPDDEKIRMAIQEIIKQNNGDVRVYANDPPGRIFSFKIYKSLQSEKEFLDQNNCCEIAERNVVIVDKIGIEPATFLEYALDEDVTVVSIRNPLQYVDDKGNIRESVRYKEISVANCGHASFDPMRLMGGAFEKDRILGNLNSGEKHD